MDERRQELGFTWTEVARRADLTPETLRLIRTKAADLQRSTKDGIEAALRWTPGSVDEILADGEPTPEEGGNTAGDGQPEHHANPGEPNFDDALELYRVALRQLRRAAAAGPAVPPEVVDVLEDWNTLLQALLYGGPPGVRKAVDAIAQSYERDRLGEEDSPRAG